MSHPPDNAHTRSNRRSRRVQQRRVAIGVLALGVVIAAGILLWGNGSRGGTEPAPSASPSASAGSAQLLLFSVGTAQPHTALVGTGGGRLPTVSALPFNLLTTIPGAGTGTVSSAMRESPEFGRTAVSNLLGVWIPTYVVLDPTMLAEMVDARGGLTVNLPRAIQVDRATVGPGRTLMTGEQVAAYLDEGTGPDRNARWERALVALFDGTVRVPQSALTDDRPTAQQQLTAAKGGVVSEFPTQPAEGGYRNAEEGLTATTLGDLFGITHGRPVPLVLLSGVKRPVLAERATADLVPAGFQIVAYQDARGVERHSRPTTSIFASEDALDDAERVARALGVGKVFLSRQESGFADITVIVGKDYLVGIE